ncbi:serine/threonine protein kinase [candidate division KSB1 bacterium]|nr:serine/threonine protein kinase [candidate division KSB1 bacterium]
MTARMFTCPLCHQTNSFRAIEGNHYACLTKDCLLSERLMIHAEFNGSGTVKKIYSWVMEPGDVLHGTYEIMGLLGKGGYGATYQAKDRNEPELIYAIKEIPREYCDNEEDAFLMKLEHPAIPKFHTHFNIEKMHYSIMEFIEGENLEQLAQSPPKSGHECIILKIIDQVCDVLGYVHSEGVIHRDLKPENIIIRRNGSAALIDFGIAKRITSYHCTRHLARAASQFYAPPEQYQTGKGITDVRSDIYSLGAILYFLLTGREPIDARNRKPDEIITPLPRELNPNISSQLEGVIIKAMAMSPEERFENIAHLKNALAETLPGTSKVCPKCGRLYRGSRMTCETCGGPTHPLGAAEHAPFVFRSGERASNLREFIQACYKNWRDAVWHLYQGDFESWLLSIQEGALAHRAVNISKYIENQDEGLNQFLMSSPFGVPPKLEVNHNTIDFFSLRSGTQKSIALRITNSGQGFLTGEIKLTNPYCSLSNRFFSCFAGDSQQVTLTIDANKLPAYREIRTNLVLESNVGSKVIPITVTSEAPVVQWKVMPAALHFQMDNPKTEVKGFSIEVTSSHGKLSGTVTPSVEWLKVTPTKFSARNQLVSVELLPFGLEPGYYKGEIAIETDTGRKDIDVFLDLRTKKQHPQPLPAEPEESDLPPQLALTGYDETEEVRPAFPIGLLFKGQLLWAAIGVLLLLGIRLHGPYISDWRPDTELVIFFLLIGGMIGLSKKMIEMLNNKLAGLIVGLLVGLLCSACWKFGAKQIYLVIHSTVVNPLIALFHSKEIMPLSITVFGLLGAYLGTFAGLARNTIKYKPPVVDFLIYFIILTLTIALFIFLAIYLMPQYWL